MSKWDGKTSWEEHSAKFFWKGLHILWELFGDQKRRMVWVMGWIAALEIVTLSFYVIIKKIFDKLPAYIGGGVFPQSIMYLLLALVALKLIQLIAKRLCLEIPFLRSLIYLENKWPVDAQGKLLALSQGWHERENTGKKITKIEKGCSRLIDIMARLRWGFLPQLFYVALNVVFILYLDWRLGLLFLAPLIPAAYLYLKAFQKVASAFEEYDIQKEESGGYFCQSVINVATVQSCVQEAREKKSFADIRESMDRLDREASIKMQIYFFAGALILWLFLIATIIIGIKQVIDGRVELGIVVYILTTGCVTLEGIWQLVHEYTQIMRRFISVFRMKELFDEEVDIKNSPGAVVPEKYEGNFAFRGVHFAYDSQRGEVLRDIDLEFRAGQMIALAGKSGEGKTTAVKLLCRVFDASEGRIELDGRDIRNLDIGWYRKQFAIVQQDVEIFDMSVLDNIRYAYPQARESQVREAVRAAHLEEALADANRFPRGLHEQVGERGVKLSGGEKQRVGIARAYISLLNGARVLVLDEATSNLDSQAERAIQEMIAALMERETISIVAIAHRLSTIRRADKIFVLGAGRISEQGSHERLIRKNGLYAKLVELQRLGALRE